MHVTVCDVHMIHQMNSADIQQDDGFVFSFMIVHTWSEYCLQIVPEGCRVMVIL